MPDWLPSLVNAGRAFAAVAIVMLFWIITGWPNGALAITFTAIGALLFAPQADLAYATTARFMVGTVLATIFAAIVAFAVLPRLETFEAFSLVFALYLIPGGALMAQPWQTAVFTAAVMNFTPLLAPTNQMSYNTMQFYNSALAIVAGIAVAAVSFRLMPPVPPALRTRRLLALTLRDLRRLAAGPLRWTAEDWDARIYARLAVLPDSAEPLQRSQFLAALLVGIGILRLRRLASLFGLDPDLDAALHSLAQGRSAMAATRLTAIDARLAAVAGVAPDAPLALRARASILAITQALVEHAAFFDAGANH